MTPWTVEDAHRPKQTRPLYVDLHAMGQFREFYEAIKEAEGELR